VPNGAMFVMMKYIEYYDVTASSLKAMVAHENSTRKCTYAEKWISKQFNSESKYKCLTDLIDEQFFELYTRAGMQDVIKLIKLENINDTSKILDLIKHMYPMSEYMQIEFIKEIITGTADDVNIFKGNKQLITDLIKKAAISFIDPECCLDLLRYGDRFGITVIDILTIAKNRVRSEYGSLAEILNRPLRGSIQPGKEQALQNLLGGLPLSEDTTIGALFSYADMKNDLEGFFVDLINPSIITEMKSKFKPSAQSPYMESREYNALFEAVHIEPLPQMARLCDYFR